MTDFLELIKSFGAPRLAAIFGVTVGVAIALGLIIMRIGAPTMTVLYADLEMRDAQSVIARLEQDGTPHKLREQGGRIAILAPRDRAARLRLDFAADGIAASNGVGYEIFDDDSALGATQFQQNINRLRALEGELSRTITAISGVRSARVHLVLPERELFAREKKTASASIVVDAPSGLEARAVKAIINLAASAVPELSPGDVTVLDSAGVLLAAATNDQNPMGAGQSEEKIAATEARLQRTVESILGRIVGPENLRVQVAADIDFSRVTENAEIIDPDSQTVLSTSVVEEAANDVDPARGRGVTVANALPGVDGITNAADAATSTNRRTEETTNYEISRTVRNAVRESGGVKRLSVAVAINAGQTPRSAEALARLETLTRAAVGYDETRGDRVSVIELPFSSAESAPIVATPAAATSALSQQQIMRLAEVAALAFIALALVIYVLRPMFRTNAVSAAAAPAQITTATVGALPAPVEGEDLLESKIDVSRVEGQVRASSLKQVSEIVKSHTDESVGILKSWIREAS